MGTKNGAHLWQRGAIQGGATEVLGGKLPQTAIPLDPPLLISYLFDGFIKKLIVL